MRPKAILFDLHGTLVWPRADNLAERRRAAYRVFREWPGAPSLAAFEARDDEVRAALREAGAADLRDYGVTHRVRLVAEGLLGVVPPPDFVARVVRAYVDAWIDGLTLPSGTIEALEALRPRYRMGLVTDFGDAPGIWRILERFGLASYFDTVVISATVGHTKPHPAMYRLALEALSVEPAAAVFVGDNLVCDVAGPREAGIRPILIDLDGQHPDYEGERIADLRDLQALLDQEARAEVHGNQR